MIVLLITARLYQQVHAQFLPNTVECSVVKHIFRYLIGTKAYDIQFAPKALLATPTPIMQVVTDSWRSISGCFIKFGYGSISGRSKLEECIATTTRKVEHVAV